MSKITSELKESFMVSNFESENEEPQKYFSIQRKAFIDEDLTATEIFSKKALCWYDMKMEQDDFEDKEYVTKQVNNWAENAVIKSKNDINPDTEIVVDPIAPNSEIFSSDKVRSGMI